jgi:hypothetical protein
VAARAMALTEFLSLSYRVEIICRDGIHYAFIPDIGVTASAASVDQTMSQLEIRKKEFFETQAALGRIDKIAVPSNDNIFRSLMPFFIKSATIGMIVAFVVAVGVTSISYTMREPLSKVIARSLHSGAAEVMSALDGSRGEQTKNALVETVEKMRPFVRELRPLVLELFPVQDLQ